MDHTTKAPLTIFGRRLREARLRAGLPQDKLGVMIGLDESTSSARMSRYESGKHEPPYNIALRLATVLNVPVAYLFCDRDDLAELLLAVSHLDAKSMAGLIENANQRAE